MKTKLLLLFLLTLNFISSSTSFDKFKQFRAHGNFVKSYSEKSALENDEDCDRQLETFSDALDKRERWSLEMFDTWAKIDSGYLETYILRYSYGHFDNCLAFRKELSQSDIIQGQHCLVTFGPSSVSTLPDEIDANFDWREIGKALNATGMFVTNGICVPATCSPIKAAMFANQFLIQADLSVLAATCQTADSPPLKALDIFAIFFFSFLLILLAASTIYDIFMRKVQVEPNKLFTAFSAYTHGRNLFDITENKSPNAINCLNGLRALSVFWIMFGHRIGNQIAFPVANMMEVLEFYKNFSNVILAAYHLAVDTFFLMGGMLATQSIMRAFETGSFNYFRVIYRRYIRYTPVWAAIVLYAVTLFTIVAKGPFTPDMGAACKKYWWSALLHIQNYVNVNDQCLNFSWYLGADFQLFIVTPFLIYPILKYGWKYLWSIPVLGFISSIYVLVFSIVNELYSNARSPGDSEMTAKWIYFPTHARIGPWMLGITLAYILKKSKNKKIEISRTLNSTLWIISLSLLAVVMCTTYPISQISDNNTSLAANVIYVAFHRFVWAAAICWIIFACHVLKTGGPIKWFLELRQFQPICRMGLSMYLVHPIYQLTTMMRLRQVLIINADFMMHIFWGDIVAVIVLATLLYLTLENPILLIDDYFYKKRQSSAKRESTKV